ncbi:hypothetical protein BKA61DRAFT_579469 [Leptodontidium sp. MPI-SDFR-AT-0119]|nr:hypothetical protein BKA61DRAFT_579469 [Leptodontidium sp. MPI-SDFR-AT-0119]
MDPYLDAIKEAPRHIEDLTTELSIFNFVLTRLKSHQELLRKWADESKVVFNGCQDTLGKIEALVVKSKIKTKDYSIKGQVTNEQLNNVAETVEKLHQNVLQLQENRKFAKEILEVMKEGHPNFEHPDVNISYNVPVTTRTAATQTSEIQTAGSTASGKVADQIDLPTFRPLQKDLLSTIAAKRWKAATVSFDGEPVSSNNLPRLLIQDCELGLVIREGRIACVQIFDIPEAFKQTLTRYGSDPANFSKLRQSDYPTCLRTYSSGKLFVDFAFAKVEYREGWTVHVDSASPQSGTWKSRPDGVVVNFGFKAAADAESFFDLLGKVKAEVEHSWNMHVRSFVNVDTKYDGNAVNMTMSAANEEYEWGNHVRLYHDSNFGFLYRLFPC